VLGTVYAGRPAYQLAQSYNQYHCPGAVYQMTAVSACCCPACTVIDSNLRPITDFSPTSELFY